MNKETMVPKGVPEAFYRIAEQQSTTGSITVEVFFDREDRDYYVKVNSFQRDATKRTSWGGPFMMADLDVMAEAFKDVVSNRERFGRL
jgi:hypothetical protein